MSRPPGKGDIDLFGLNSDLSFGGEHKPHSLRQSLGYLVTNTIDGRPEGLTLLRWLSPNQFQLRSYRALAPEQGNTQLFYRRGILCR